MSLRSGVMLMLGMTVIAACEDSKEIDVMTSEQPSAFRMPPARVGAVTIDGIRYAQRFGEETVDGQVGGLLTAYDAADQPLWTLKVYDNVRQSHLEGDVQDVFFRSLTQEPDGRLRIVNERNEAFLVDVKTRIVTALPKLKSVGGGFDPNQPIVRPPPP